MADVAAACRAAGVRFGAGLSPYEIYLDFGAEARDALQLGLSQPVPATESVPVVEPAERIKHLIASRSIEANPERAAPKRPGGEEPVTARIRRRQQADPAPEPAHAAEPVPADREIPHSEADKPENVGILPFPPPADRSPVMRPDHRQSVRARRGEDRQLSLF